MWGLSGSHPSPSDFPFEAALYDPNLLIAVYKTNDLFHSASGLQMSALPPLPKQWELEEEEEEEPAPE
ncbi:hypothetical protein K435DRAFT_856861 [Dendrothele bispora CBS 962.96]|uniref:Uncharacterized protein n=1 Tax=Dendrothele bispora (strain CBS 962.96) TaxID=1314807 RepID=A0A4S8M8P9_DENBC|nr:hypothetical protein K435DRAFT_878327 [Dendrothele bispora CBS 962.96]THU98223.1 hypothetical protein K435DRAFT_856861 [Dendrothele bispora CBS 962.96]